MNKKNKRNEYAYNYNCGYNDECMPYEDCSNFNQLAVAYVLSQNFCGVMDPHESLVKGTVFRELYSPYCADNKRCQKTKNCC